MTIFQETADKLAVVESLYQFAAGLDLRDEALLASALAADAIADFGPAGKKTGVAYPVLEGRETIVAALRGALNNIDTTHSASNPRVSLAGDKATLDVLVDALHLPATDHSRHYLMKNRYAVDLVRQSAGWVIQRLTIDNIWRTGDPGILTGH